ncbi:unnamed protein product [Didymodactylos carnosus]|uniref:nicotinamidase n=1 Tax=Didymodactylos carnosus TaxID=1234261 RepID=A0A813NEG3_9BILA|nr:unnamed protein product [Didymodactylos carnosus]CAF1010632.1 unnamed protein product [Didymodactylos carnosus]CAF3516287.1 unnamed protein product [Didymodactylos carnosus]CAF3779475.1 unnamed protein product [Didymodactylos carnosus]
MPRINFQVEKTRNKLYHLKMEQRNIKRKYFLHLRAYVHSWLLEIVGIFFRALSLFSTLTTTPKQNKTRVNALLIVDVQNDFITGSLSLRDCPSKHEGEEVVPVINHLLSTIKFDVIAYTQDWHPGTHISFYECLPLRKHLIAPNSPVTEANAKVFDQIRFSGDIEQILWPAHCVQHTRGADLHEELYIIDSKTPENHMNKNTPIIRLQKGTDAEIDSYSAFWDNQKISKTTLDADLKKHHVTDVYVAGIATDVCVYSTALHSCELQYRTYVIEDACRGVDETAIKSKLQELQSHSCQIINSSKVKCLIEGTRAEQQELNNNDIN